MAITPIAWLQAIHLGMFFFCKDTVRNLTIIFTYWVVLRYSILIYEIRPKINLSP
jgi:hypothetical protein